MKLPVYDESLPEEQRGSSLWDELEIGTSRRNLGYTYQYRNRRDWSLRAVRKLVPKGGAILDVAGASGNFTLPLAEDGYRMTWNDLRPRMADHVKSKYESGEIEFAVGNVFDLASGWRERFDAILACEIIEHIAHPDQFLATLASMIKPGGRIILTTPNGRYFRFHFPRFSDCPDPSAYESVQFKPGSEGHIFLLDSEELRSMAAGAGLLTDQLELMTNPLTRGHIKLGHLLPYLPASLVRAIESGTSKTPKPIRAKLNCQMCAVLRKPAAN